VAAPEADVKALIQAAQTLHADNDLDGAIRAYDRALASTSSDRDRVYVLVCRGSAKDEAGDFDGAVADYEEAVALAPEDPGAWFMRGLAHQGRADWPAALHDFDAAIERDPENAEFYAARGVTRYLVANWQGAGEDLARAMVFSARRLKRAREVPGTTSRSGSGVHDRALLFSRRKPRRRSG
jgi:tetratricopeptide (TPR) repeat protein